MQEAADREDNFLSSVNVEEIKKIEITKDVATTTLEKVDNKLKIEGTKDFYVDDEVANKILDAISDTKTVALTLVSSSKEKKSEFETDESGIGINIVQEGKDAINFVVGKLSSNFKDNYISVSNLPNTYSVAQNLISIFDQDEWRGKRIFKTESDKITKIRFQRPDGEFIIEKSLSSATSTIDSEDNKWKGTSPLEFNVNNEKAEEIVEVMSSLAAAQIPEQKFEGTGLEQHLLIVQATGKEVDNTIMIGTAFTPRAQGLEENLDQVVEELFYVKSGDSDNIYLITKEDKDALDKQIADFTE